MYYYFCTVETVDGIIILYCCVSQADFTLALKSVCMHDKAWLSSWEVDEPHVAP